MDTILFGIKIAIGFGVAYLAFALLVGIASAMDDGNGWCGCLLIIVVILIVIALLA